MRTSVASSAPKLANELALHFAAFSAVVAVALGGSQASGIADIASDIDLYVYTESELPRDAQAAVIERADGATHADLHLPYWGGVKMWINAPTRITVDCKYFDAA